MWSRPKCLLLAASAEQMSKHPAARAVINLAREANVDFPQAESLKKHPGKGVTATVDGQLVLGRARYILERKGH